ncbi:hypothetical protein HAX54_015283, partial [Datura stramonium]|nr:hypothetical protein [Datura stramonium]
TPYSLIPTSPPPHLNPIFVEVFVEDYEDTGEEVLIPKKSKSKSTKEHIPSVSRLSTRTQPNEVGPSLIGGLEDVKPSLSEIFARRLPPIDIPTRLINRPIHLEIIDRLNPSLDKALADLKDQEDRLTLKSKFTIWSGRMYNLEQGKADMDDIDAKILKDQELEILVHDNLPTSPQLRPASLSSFSKEEEVEEEPLNPGLDTSTLISSSFSPDFPM